MAKTNHKKINFEDAMQELERIILSMENGQMPLQDSILSYQRGMELLNHCQNQLNSAELIIQQLNGNALEPFETQHHDPIS